MLCIKKWPLTLETKTYPTGEEENATDGTHPALLVEPLRQEVVVVPPPEGVLLRRLHSRHVCFLRFRSLSQTDNFDLQQRLKSKLVSVMNKPGNKRSLGIIR